MQEKLTFATSILISVLAWLTRLALATEATTPGRELRRLFVTIVVGGVAFYTIPEKFEYGYFAVAFVALIADDILYGIIKLGASFKKDPLGFINKIRKGNK